MDDALKQIDTEGMQKIAKIVKDSISTFQTIGKDIDISKDVEDFTYEELSAISMGLTLAYLMYQPQLTNALQEIQRRKTEYGNAVEDIRSLPEKK